MKTVDPQEDSFKDKIEANTPVCGRKQKGENLVKQREKHRIVLRQRY